MTAVAEAAPLANPISEAPPGYYVGPAGSWRTLPLDFDPYDYGRTGLAWGVIEWCEGVEDDGSDSALVHHLTGDPWRFSDGQRAFLLRWYSVDENGRFAYRRGVKRGAKGTGKDPFQAAIALAELCGPVRYAGHDADGHAYGQVHRLALVQLAANSAAQASDVLRVVNAMARDELGLDKGTTRTQTDTGSRIELLTASESSSEGDPATAILLNETHHMTEGNGGMAVAAVAQRNVGKSPRDLQARLLSFTNAHRQGGGSRAEVDFEAWQAQVSGRTRNGKLDILYDSIEAPPTVDMTDPDSLRAGIEAAYSDAPWSDIERLCDEANDPATSVADLIRFYLNGLAAAEDAWVDPGLFDALARPDVEVADREQIAMFLDCSKSGDATGLMACRISDGHWMTLDVWQRPSGWNAKQHGPWTVDRSKVDARVREVFGRYTVVWFGVDPSPAEDDEGTSYWMPTIDGWHRDFKDKLPVWATPGAQGHAVLFDMRLSAPGATTRMREFTAMAEQIAQDIDEDAALTHDGDPTLRVHVHNARRRPNQWGVSIGKVNRASTKLVDLAVCGIGAALGRRIALNSGKDLARKRPGRVW